MEGRTEGERQVVREGKRAGGKWEGKRGKREEWREGKDDKV